MKPSVVWCIVAIIVVALLIAVWMYVRYRKHHHHPHGARRAVPRHAPPPHQAPRNRTSHLETVECRARAGADVFGGVDEFEGMKHEM